MITIVAGTPAGNSSILADWLRDHDLVPEHIYKLNISTKDGKLTVYQYGLDEDGEIYKDEASGEVAREEPYGVELQSDLPDEVIDLIGKPANWMEAEA